MADCLQLRCSKDAAPPFGQEVREKLFSLRKDLVFANHGSFGTVPRSVSEAQRRLQDEIELEPDKWFKETSEKVWDLAADAVARFVNAQPENIALVANATTAANCVIKSLSLSENDSILIADHTYPAVCHTVEALQESTRAKIISHIFPYPVESEDHFCATFLSTLESDASIRLAIIDHITSQSAMVLPIRKLIGMCHERNVDVLVDGAHAPGHVPLDLEALGADYYTGNLHKWMYSPRGCAFLYARRDKQDCLQPPITSHYWKRDFRERFMEQGTRDFTPQCCALTAVQFYQWLGDLVGVKIICPKESVLLLKYRIRFQDTIASSLTTPCPCWRQCGRRASRSYLLA